jgi:hypothetical protein
MTAQNEGIGAKAEVLATKDTDINKIQVKADL